MNEMRLDVERQRLVLEEQRVAMERIKHHFLLQEHGFVTMDNEVNIITDVLQ